MKKGEEREEYRERVAENEERKLRAIREKDRSIWFGLGMFGMVGWSIAIPTLIGAALGIWLDSRMGGGVSWTLMLVVAGLAAGCLNAWFWVQRERKEIGHREKGKEERDGRE